MPLARLALCALLAGPVCAAASAAEPDGLDKELLAGVLRASSVTAPGRQAAWPGYDLLSQPVLLYRDTGLAFLINHPSPPAGFSPYPAEDFPQFNVSLSTIPLAGIETAFYTAYPLGGRLVFALRYGAGDDAPETVNTVVHERFHAAQDDRGGTAPLFQDLYSGQELLASDIEPENLALAALEEALLARALLDGRKDSEAVKDFVSVRLLRRELFGEKWALLDNDQERLEGITEYVAGRIDGLIGRDGGVFSPETLALRLLRGPGQGEAAEHMLHGRQYKTGAAVCLLLDRRVPGWKRRAAGKEYLFEILAKAAPVAPAQRRARVTEAKKELGYEAKLVQARYALAGAREAIKRDHEAFLAYTGPRLVLRALRTGDTKVSYRSATTHKISENSELFVDNPLYEFANGEVQLLVKDATLQVFTDKEGFDLIQVLLSSSPAVSAGGRPAALTASPAGAEDVLVEGPQVALRARHALLQGADGAVYVDLR